jgi:hypothetical protein
MPGTYGVILSETKQPCLEACPLRAAQGDSVQPKIRMFSRISYV